MIDEKKLIEELEDMIGILPIHYIGKKDEENAYLDAINRTLSAVKRQSKVKEWIPVEKNPDQTLDFKHFKLYGDNTLKNMNKEELVSYIYMLYRNWASCDKTCQNLINHAKKLSDSNDELRKQLYFCEPYRFEDLYESMWVWDDKTKWLYRIKRVNSMNSIEVDSGNLRYTNLVYEVNRFYPVTKVFNNQ